MDSDEAEPARQQTPALSEATDVDASSQVDGIDTLYKPHQAERIRSRRRTATIYDAVAGRLSHHRGTLTKGEDSIPRPVSKYSLRETKLGPDEVLFRRKNAPQRYAEHDMYHAHERDLPRGGRGVLPASDLLKAVHGYAGRFHVRMRARRRRMMMGTARGGAEMDINIDDASMDETALLAFGILLEEAGRGVLGKKGDMVFTEGAVGEEEEELLRGRRRQILADAVGPLQGMGESSQARTPKRRRVSQNLKKS